MESLLEEAIDTLDELNQITKLINKINPIYLQRPDEFGLNDLIDETIEDAKKVIWKIDKENKKNFDKNLKDKINNTAHKIMVTIVSISNQINAHKNMSTD